MHKEPQRYFDLEMSFLQDELSVTDGQITLTE